MRIILDYIEEALFMNKSLMRRLALLSFVVVVAIALFLPSIPSVRGSLPEWWTKNKALGNKINLGLDLQGGMHLVYQVQSEVALASATGRMADNLKAAADKKGIGLVNIAKVSDTEIEATLVKADDADKFLSVASEMGALEKKSMEGPKVVLEVAPAEAERIKTNSVSQALETIRNRIDQFGVAEPVIVQQGKDEILVQLPGVKDPQRALDLIGKTALLEFKMLDEETKLNPPLPDSVSPGDTDALLVKYQGQVPPDDEILFERMVDNKTQAVSKRPYLIKKQTMMTGDVLTEARMSIGSNNENQVSFKLDPVGAQTFGTLTTQNVRKRMAIIMDGNVYSAPEIREPITGGDGVITGRFTENDAKDLAIVLKAGALPAPLKSLQNLTVGSTLGNDSIESERRPS